MSRKKQEWYSFKVYKECQLIKNTKGVYSHTFYLMLLLHKFDFKIYYSIFLKNLLTEPKMEEQV